MNAARNIYCDIYLLRVDDLRDEYHVFNVYVFSGLLILHLTISVLILLDDIQPI